MNTIRFYTTLLALTIILSSCNTSKNSEAKTYIGGEIVNPYVNELVLYKDNLALDTIPIDGNNRFGQYFEELEAGNYILSHRNENPLLYLVPGDSLLIYANTVEFDESIYFSGKGADKNNLLANLHLKSKNNNEFILSFRETEPEAFLKEAERLLQEHRDYLARKQEKHEFPQSFIDYVEGHIKYNNYDLRERYLYMIRNYFPEQAEKISEDFFTYREDADFNNETLQSDPAYLRFIGNHLVNLSLKKSPGNPSPRKNIYNHNNIITRINLIDSLTTLKPVKDHFFSKLGALGMVMGQSKEQLVNVLTILARKGYSREGREELRQLGTIQLFFMPGVSIGNIPVINTSGEEIVFKEALSGNTIAYIWSMYSPNHSKTIHEVMAEFQNKYPEIDFIGINIDVGEPEQWAYLVQQEGFDPKQEYQLGKTEIKEDLFEYYVNKLVFLNAEGEVMVGDALYDSPDFEERIVEFLNQ